MEIADLLTFVLFSVLIFICQMLAVRRYASVMAKVQKNIIVCTLKVFYTKS